MLNNNQSRRIAEKTCFRKKLRPLIQCSNTFNCEINPMYFKTMPVYYDGSATPEHRAFSVCKTAGREPDGYAKRRAWSNIPDLS